MVNDTVLLRTSYQDFLNSRRPFTVSHTQIVESHMGKLMLATAPVYETVVGALNCNVDFSRFSKISLPYAFPQATARESLPEFFDWSLTNIITPPMNQGKCGSCWAFSVATSIQDNLVIQKFAPDGTRLSITDLVSCAPSLKCGGGNPADTLAWIQDNGITRARPDDLDWCLVDTLCTGGNQKNITTDELNQIVPNCETLEEPEEKCYVGNITTTGITEQNATDASTLLQLQDTIRRVLYTKGSVIAGFNVYSNFVSGVFFSEDNPDNIYLDRVDYETRRRMPLSYFTLEGGHAVVVVGWGKGKVRRRLLVEDGGEEFVDVPYWIVRNSWTTKWGMNGYFRIAMYPYNRDSQLDVTVFVREVLQDQDNQWVQKQVPVGGMLFYDILSFGNPSSPKVKETKTDNTSPIGYTLKQQEPQIKTSDQEQKHKEVLLWFVFGGLCGLVLLMLLIVFVTMSSLHRTSKKK